MTSSVPLRKPKRLEMARDSDPKMRRAASRMRTEIKVR